MVGSTTPVDRFTSTRRDDRVSYILRAPETKHRFGITSLQLAQDQLYTAGRDGTIRSWKVPVSAHRSANTTLQPDACVATTNAKHLQTFDEHIDWVNDIVLIKAYDRLVSCSSDTTVKVWNASDSSKSLRTLAEHTDYVKALALVSNGVASGSLDGRVLVWDLVTGNVRTECGVDTEEAQARKGSVYCMAGSVDGNILVSGSTDKTISVWDLRTGDRVVRLPGHSDSIRCLTMKHDSTLMLSGGTDATVKLWDLRQERCLRSFDSYANGSVWAVAANYNFDGFVSGGRDGSVWYTDITADVASLVVQIADKDLRSNMVLDVALTPCNSAVWVSTTGSTVRMWPMPSSADMSGMADVASVSFPGVEKRTRGLNAKSQGNTNSYHPTPICVVPGLPGIIAHRIMNDRRHVLTCDTQKQYCIWDITRGTLKQSLGIIENTDIEEVLKKHDTEVSVPSWFHVDIRLGSLSVRLDKNNAANAEIYAVDAGLEAESEDVKVNIGEHVLRGLFRKWLEEYRKVDSDEDHYHDRSPPTTLQKNAANRAAELPQYILPDHIPVIVTEEQAPVPILRRRVASFQGNEHRLMPRWVVDLLRDGKCQIREVVKISFSLEPAEGCGLPELPITTLNAPRVLRVRKVAGYIAKELRDAHANIDVEDSQLDVLCNGQVLPSTMSLATVRQFRWRLPEDLCLQFRMKTKV